jgi:hypothetical protein
MSMFIPNSMGHGFHSYVSLLEGGPFKNVVDFDMKNSVMRPTGREKVDFSNKNEGKNKTIIKNRFTKKTN